MILKMISDKLDKYSIVLKKIEVIKIATIMKEVILNCQLIWWSKKLFAFDTEDRVLLVNLSFIINFWVLFINVICEIIVSSISKKIVYNDIVHNVSYPSINWWVIPPNAINLNIYFVFELVRSRILAMTNNNTINNKNNVRLYWKRERFDDSNDRGKNKWKENVKVWSMMVK